MGPAQLSRKAGRGLGTSHLIMEVDTVIKAAGLPAVVAVVLIALLAHVLYR